MFACKNRFKIFSRLCFVWYLTSFSFSIPAIRFLLFSSRLWLCMCVWLCLTIYATKSLSTRFARRCSHRIHMSEKAHEFEVVKLSTHKTRVEKWNKCNLFIDLRGIRNTHCECRQRWLVTSFAVLCVWLSSQEQRKQLFNISTCIKRRSHLHTLDARSLHTFFFSFKSICASTIVNRLMSSSFHIGFTNKLLSFFV